MGVEDRRKRVGEVLRRTNASFRQIRQMTAGRSIPRSPRQEFPPACLLASKNRKLFSKKMGHRVR
jgi:hypothetical protein